MHQTYDDSQGAIVRREIPFSNLIGFHHGVVPSETPLEIPVPTEKEPLYKRALMTLKEVYFLPYRTPPAHVVLVRYWDAEG